MYAESLIGNILALYLEAAPWLVFGLFMAGLIKAWMPEKGLQRWLGGKGFRSVFIAAVAGAPLPICSCGVLPVAVGLRRAGASREATVSFMISTPETGIDSVAVSFALLGPFMAVVRPIAAVASAVATGMLTALAPEETAPVGEKPAACRGCCGTEAAETRGPGPRERTLSGLGYAFSDVLHDITPWLALGLVLAGAVATFVPFGALSAWGGGAGAMAVMLVAGIPMYICATASTPVAAALLMAGVSPGAVMVFLLAGPATNVATVAVVRKELGGRVALLYLVGIAVTSLAAGFSTDALVAAMAIDIGAEMSAGGEFIPPWLAMASGAVLAVLAARPYGTRLVSTFARKTA